MLFISISKRLNIRGVCPFKGEKLGRPVVILYTGSGKGKTTASLGLALRSLGHNMKVAVIQFLKGMKDTGEVKAGSVLPENFRIYQFGRMFFIENEPPENDIKRSEEALNFAEKLVFEDEIDVLILDEINLAVSLGMIDGKKVIEFIDSIDRDMIVVLTGRMAPRMLIDRADIATEMVELKYVMGGKPRKGIEI